MAKRHTPQRHPRDDDDSQHSTTSISSDADEDEEEDEDEDESEDEEEEEDRGDDVSGRGTGTGDDDDDDDEEEEEDEEEEDEDEPDADEETLRDITGSGTVPLSRLNEVLEQNRQLTERLIAATGGGKPAPVADDPPAFDLKAKTKERNAKLLEGDEDAAAALDGEIADYYQQQAATTATNAARAVIEQDRTNAAVAEVMRDYPQLNDAKAKTFDANALKEVITLRNGYIQDGMTVADALRKAAKRLLGKAAAVEDDDDEDRARGKRKVADDPNKRSVKQLRGAMKKAQRIPPSLRNAGGSGRPAGSDLSAEQLAHMPESRFRRMDAKTKAKARGDFVESGSGGDD